MSINLIDDAIQKLAKWRLVFTGWQLGTRAKGDPEGDAVRDHREVTILLRAEVNAITTILIKKGIVTQQQLSEAVAEEAMYLDKKYEEKFPGFSTSLDGVHMDVAKCVETTRGWRP